MKYHLKVNTDRIQLGSSSLHTANIKVKNDETLIVEMVKSKPIIKYDNEKYDILMYNYDEEIVLPPENKTVTPDMFTSLNIESLPKSSSTIYKSITIKKALELKLLIDITKGIERDKKISDLGI
jgi:hypothetical protein